MCSALLFWYLRATERVQVPFSAWVMKSGNPLFFKGFRSFFVIFTPVKFDYISHILAIFPSLPASSFLIYLNFTSRKAPYNQAKKYTSVHI